MAWIYDAEAGAIAVDGQFGGSLLALADLASGSLDEILERECDLRS